MGLRAFQACPKCGRQARVDGLGRAVCPSCGLQFPSGKEQDPERALQARKTIIVAAVLIVVFVGVLVWQFYLKEWVSHNPSATPPSGAFVIISIVWLLFELCLCASLIVQHGQAELGGRIESSSDLDDTERRQRHGAPGALPRCPKCGKPSEKIADDEWQCSYCRWKFVHRDVSSRA